MDACRWRPVAIEIAAQQHDFSAMIMAFCIMKFQNAALRKNFSIREIEFHNVVLNM
ncbi:hypothetical protein ACFIQG_04050 [Comamonas odontotermitis]